MIIFELILISIIGACFGSFISLLSYRLALKKFNVNQKDSNIIFAHSRCCNCGIRLKAINLMPIFSWILQKGCCHYCGIKISVRYILIEIFTLFVFALLYTFNQFHFNVGFILQIMVFVILLTMIITDIEHFFIPNILQIFLIFVGCAIIYNQNIDKDFEKIFGISLVRVWSSFVYFLIVFMISIAFFLYKKILSIGVDDLKFFAVSGFILGLQKMLLFFFLSGVIGVLFGYLWLAIKKQREFPFAPPICISLFLCLDDFSFLIKIFDKVILKFSF